MTETPKTSRRPLWMYETPSPRSSSSDLGEIGMFSHHTRSADLVGVLEQVSELTMEDDAFSKSGQLRTPIPLNPRPAPRHLPIFEETDATSKQNMSPSVDFRSKPVRHGISAATTTPSKLMTAPPLPSSPDLSAGGQRRPIPPQFSPLGSSHVIDIGPLLMRRANVMDDVGDDEMSLSPEGLPPVASPPTPQVVGLPPPMPWIETPEQGPRKRLLVNQLQMRKGPFSFL